ncbi:MAG: phosphatidylglycerol lysyltransferase domain-containing protein [Eubacteriales bacterium]
MNIRREDFKSIELKDKDIIEKFLAGEKKLNSDACFANLYMWQKMINLRYIILGDALIIAAGKEDACFLTPPYLSKKDLDLSPYMSAINECMLRVNGFICIRAVNERVKEKIKKDFSDVYDIVEDRNNFEYVYDVNKLITLPGKKYHSKKNHVNRFIKEYDYEYDAYSDIYFEECMQMQESWSKEKDFSDKYSYFESDAIERALKHYKELGLSGCVIKIGGKIKAFSFGTALNEDTALILVEKADYRYQGIYQIINRDFLRHNFYNYKFVNRQEDMGDEGLRQAKMSYHPVSFAKKYTVRSKGCGKCP